MCDKTSRGRLGEMMLFSIRSFSRRQRNPNFDQCERRGKTLARTSTPCRLRTIEDNYVRYYESSNQLKHNCTLTAVRFMFKVFETAACCRVQILENCNYVTTLIQQRLAVCCLIVSVVVLLAEITIPFSTKQRRKVQRVFERAKAHVDSTHITQHQR